MIGLKIGKSKRLPEVRGTNYNTAVPLPYEIYATLQTEKYNEAGTYDSQKY